MLKTKIYVENGNTLVINASEELKRQAVAKTNGYIFKGLEKSDFPTSGTHKNAYNDYLFKVDLLQKALYDNKADAQKALANILAFLGCNDCKINIAELTAKRFNANKVDYTTIGGMKIKALNEEIRALEYDKTLSEDERAEKAKELRAEVRKIKDNEPCFEYMAIWQLPARAFKQQVEEFIGAYYANANLQARFVPLAERDWNGGKGRKWIDKAEKHNSAMLESGKPEKVIDIAKYHKTFDLVGLKAEVQYYWNGGNGTPDAVYGALDAIKADAEKKDAEKDAEKKESAKATKKAKK